MSFRRGIVVLNQILSDLKCDIIYHLTDEIDINTSKVEALYYGVAMLITIIQSDSSKNRLFTEIYNLKRAMALSCVDRIEDKMPNVHMG